MRRSKLLLTQRMQSVGILVWLALLIPHSESLRGSAVILQAKAKAAEAKLVEADDDTSNGTTTTTVASNSTKPHLTGIPQIDYVHDPNLPRELNGHNLTDYPFFNALPEEINFKCDGLHDGFYASVPHKCQVYHHCLYGFRYDFLCANYTAFDQKTFICHFVSEVDCENSPKHFKRNEDLYKEASTPASTTTTTTTTTVATTRAAAAQPAGNGGTKHGNPNRRRRPGPYRRRRPIMYDYYYDDEEYAEPEYYDDEAVVAQNHRRPLNRKQSKEPHDHHNTRDTQDSETVDYEQPSLIKPSVRPSSGSMASSVYERPRVPPKIRRPVPKSERDKYDYVPKASSFSSTVAPTEKTTTAAAHAKKATTTAAPASDDEYYEDEEYEYDEPRTSLKTKHQTPSPPPPPPQQQQNADYDFPTGFEDTHRYVPRPHRGRQPARKRTDVYDDYDVKERPRMNRRKEYPRHDERPRLRPMFRNKNQRDDEGGYSVKKRPTVEPEHTRRRPEKRPTYDDDYYYDEEEELPPKRNRRPAKTAEKAVKPSTTKQPKSERPPPPPPSTESKPPPTTEASARHTKVTAPYSSAPQRTAKASSLENETTKENEIPTTEHISLRTTQKYKMVKIPIIQNVVREDAAEEPADYSLPTEETKSSSTHSRPVTTVVLKTYPTSKRPLDEMPNKTITTIRHFVIAPPVRKPSHYGFVNSAPVVLNSSSFRDEAVASKLPEQKTHPQQQQQHSNFFSRPTTQYIKIPVSMSSIAPQLNHTYHAPATAFGGYYVPIEQPLKSKQAKPVEEPLGENLNAISNGINYNSVFESTKSQPYRTAAAQAQAQPAQDQRLYSNALSFPQRPPPSYDITAPGPSAPAEETNSAAVESKRYSELPAYTANADYDVTYNDALQPSTLHPVRRYPSTSFYVQTHQNAPPRRQTSEYAFNEGTFHTLNRSQNRYSN